MGSKWRHWKLHFNMFLCNLELLLRRVSVEGAGAGDGIGGRQGEPLGQKACPRWGSNSRPSDYETDALPTALRRLYMESTVLQRQPALYLTNKCKKWLRRPGIEPGSTAWKAAMLTTIPLTLCIHECRRHLFFYTCVNRLAFCSFLDSQCFCFLVSGVLRKQNHQ